MHIFLFAEGQNTFQWQQFDPPHTGELGEDFLPCDSDLPQDVMEFWHTIREGISYNTAVIQCVEGGKEGRHLADGRGFIMRLASAPGRGYELLPVSKSGIEYLGPLHSIGPTLNFSGVDFPFRFEDFHSLLQLMVCTDDTSGNLKRLELAKIDLDTGKLDSTVAVTTKDRTHMSINPEGRGLLSQAIRDASLGYLSLFGQNQLPLA